MRCCGDLQMTVQHCYFFIRNQIRIKCISKCHTHKLCTETRRR
jgi:hypothetical protein